MQLWEYVHTSDSLSSRHLTLVVCVSKGLITSSSIVITLLCPGTSACFSGLPSGLLVLPLFGILVWLVTVGDAACGWLITLDVFGAFDLDWFKGWCETNPEPDFLTWPLDILGVTAFDLTVVGLAVTAVGLLGLDSFSVDNWFRFVRTWLALAAVSWASNIPALF